MPFFLFSYTLYRRCQTPRLWATPQSSLFLGHDLCGQFYRHAVDVDAEFLFSLLLLRPLCEERILGPGDGPLATGSLSRLSTTDCAPAESEPGGGRYPNTFCSSDWSLRASSAVRVLIFNVLSPLSVNEVKYLRVREFETIAR